MNHNRLRTSLPATVVLTALTLCSLTSTALLAGCASGAGDKSAKQGAGQPSSGQASAAGGTASTASTQPELTVVESTEAQTVSEAMPPPARKPVVDAAKPEPRKPEAPKAETPKTEQPKAQPEKAELPPLIVHPEAVLISERARETLKAIRTIGCETMLEGSGASVAGIETLGVWHRVQMRFQSRDGLSIPHFRISRLTRSADGDVAGPTVVYSGNRAIEFDERTQTYTDLGNNWFQAVGAALPALPQWILEERFKIAQRARTPADAPPSPLDPIMVGARILATEQLDGQTCDVVEFLIERPLMSMNEDGGVSGVVGRGLATETIHYARSDSLPRRIVRQEIETPDTPGVGGDRLTFNYAKFVLNPGYEEAFFSTNPPPGFKPQAAPQR